MLSENRNLQQTVFALSLELFAESWVTAKNIECKEIKEFLLSGITVQVKVLTELSPYTDRHTNFVQIWRLEEWNSLNSLILVMVNQ